MHLRYLNELREKNLLTEEQYQHLEPILSRKIISVFYELRIMLYLGVMLLTTGIGILIYENIGDIGHILSIIGLCVLTIVSFGYCFLKVGPYSNEKVTNASPYFDYVVLLGCLLFISVLGYLQFQYSLLDENLEATTLITAVFFFFAAYRFDHLGVLSLAITALASFWGISVSPQKWYSGDFFPSSDLHITAMVFAAIVSTIALLLDRRMVKPHFTFTYLNFCCLIFLTGAIAGVLMERPYGLFLLLLYTGCGLAVWFAFLRKSFLFLLYAFIYGYVGTTYFLTDFLLHDPYVWFLYIIGSCGGFMFFILRYRNYFKRAS